MSRVEIKRGIKKKKRQLKILLVLIMMLLITGILSVDYALREMLALEGARALGYERQEEYTIVDFMGKSIYIENEKIEGIYTYIEDGYYKILEQVNGILKKIKNVGKADIFLK